MMEPSDSAAGLLIPEFDGDEPLKTCIVNPLFFRREQGRYNQPPAESTGGFTITSQRFHIINELAFDKDVEANLRPRAWSHDPTLWSCYNMSLTSSPMKSVHIRLRLIMQPPENPIHTTLDEYTLARAVDIRSDHFVTFGDVLSYHWDVVDKPAYGFQIVLNRMPGIKLFMDKREC